MKTEDIDFMTVVTPRIAKCKRGVLSHLAAFALIAAFAVGVAAPASHAQNLVINPNFSLGNTGFTSGYTYYNTTGSQQPVGTYSVGTNPQMFHTAWSSFGDHTTGSGQMMMFNGSNVPGTKAWTSSAIVVTQNTQYYFSTWVTSVYPISPSILQFSINNASVGGNFMATSGTPDWKQFYVAWNSGTNTTASLSVLNQNTDLSGNDFALDDIAFSTAASGGINAASAAPEPGTISLFCMGLITGVGGVAGTRGAVRQRRRGKAESAA